MDGLIGTILGERYLIERKLGEGGFGTVFAAEHIRTQAKVAIKVLTQEMSAGVELRERFKDEVQILGRLTHPHIVQIHDCGETPAQLPFLAMELLPGEDLESRLTRSPRLPLTTVIQIAEQVGSALITAHRAGIVHRDIKPHNIFLVECPPPCSSAILCKVLDFGIAKFKRKVPLTVQNSILGTPSYMSPEAIRGDIEAIDFRSDQWSLGVVVYRALAGRLPFDGPDMMSTLYQVIEALPPPLASFCPNVPSSVSIAVARALAKVKADRFPAVADFIAALKLDVPARPLAPPKSRPAPLLSMASMGALAVSLLALGNTQRSSSSRPSVPPPSPAFPSQPVAAPPSQPVAAPTPVVVIAKASSPPKKVSADSGPSGSVGKILSSAAHQGAGKAARPRSGTAAVTKHPTPETSDDHTSKEDIDALFGHEYLGAAPEHPERGR